MEDYFYYEKRIFAKEDYMFFAVVADIGGNNSYFGLMGVKSKKDFDIIIKKAFTTSAMKETHEVINTILTEAKDLYDIEVNRCCLGAAGPVSRKRGYIKLTNFDLEVNAQKILQNTLLNKVLLVNDFESIGYGIDLLDLANDAMRLPHIERDLSEPGVMSNPIAVIGAGSGLGVAIAYYDPKRHLHIPLPSEGGHIDFAPQDSLEHELADFLRSHALTKKDAHPEMERVVSGNGIISNYTFLRSKKLFGESTVAGGIDVLPDIEKLRAIDEHNGMERYCTETITMFMRFFARAARSVALMSECYSGLFISGTIAFKNLHWFFDKRFMEEFEKHDKRTDVLRKIPVYIIKNKNTGLYGCCNVAANFFNIG